MSDRASREFEYWTPEPIWKGEPAFVLASGPSLTHAVVEKVRRRHTIAVNSSCLLAPWAEVLFFTDSSWYEQHRDIVANWPGLVICMSRTAKRELPDKVKRVLGEGDPDLPPSFHRRGAIQQGRSSGHSALSLSVALGAKPNIMLGFDMRLVDGRQHCHSDYGARDVKAEADTYRLNFVPGFAGWNAAAIAGGTEILNATPGSAVTEFPMVDLDEVLTCAPA